jgi:CheY-like chemotaxis protein
MRVLVAEDNEDFRDMLSRVITLLGHQVVAAVADGMRMLGQEAYRLWTKPSILITGTNDREIRDLLRKKEDRKFLVAYLTKPATDMEIGTALEKYELENERRKDDKHRSWATTTAILEMAPDFSLAPIALKEYLTRIANDAEMPVHEVAAKLLEYFGKRRERDENELSSLLDELRAKKKKD